MEPVSLRTDAGSSDPGGCFERVDGALLMGCAGETGYNLLSGRADIAVQIQVGAIRGADVVRRLEPLNRAAASVMLLRPPARLTCREFAGLAPWFAVKLPGVLRPTGCR